MAIPQPTIGFRFDGGSTNEVFGAGALTLTGPPVITSGGLQFDATGERAQLAIPSGACPPSWSAFTMWVRVAFAQSGYSGVFGIGRGTAMSAPQYTAAMMFSSSGNMTGRLNNTAGSGSLVTSTIAVQDRGASASDYADTQDLFIVFSGANNGCNGYKDSSAGVTTDTSNSGTTTAPLYSTPTVYMGSVPNDSGNPRMRVYAAAIWANALSTTQIDEVIADTGFNFLVAPQRVQRVVQVARQRTPAYVPKRQLVTAITSPISDAVTPDSGSAGFGRRRTAVFVRKNADWINRRAG